MRTKLSNVEAVIAAIEAGDFCDVGHYYCPRPLAGGGYIFPSGGVVQADGLFKGPRGLYEQLVRIQADYRPEPVAPRDRYPQRGDGLDPFGELAKRVCACYPT